MAKVHYEDAGIVACGRHSKSLLLTSVISDVTCKNCERTNEFNDAYNDANSAKLAALLEKQPDLNKPIVAKDVFTPRIEVSSVEPAYFEQSKRNWLNPWVWYVIILIGVVFASLTVPFVIWN